jgi:hypothetical protein
LKSVAEHTGVGLHRSLGETRVGLLGERLQVLLELHARPKSATFLPRLYDNIRPMRANKLRNDRV